MFPILEETLEAIYKYRTNDKIVIVDYFSSNDSYLLEIEKKTKAFQKYYLKIHIKNFIV